MDSTNFAETEEEETEAAKVGESEAFCSGILAEWERMHCTRSLSDPFPIGCSLVAIRDRSPDSPYRDSVVFPPGNHENLQALHKITHQNYHEPSSPSPPSLSPSSVASSSLSFYRDNDDSASSSPRFSPPGTHRNSPKQQMPSRSSRGDMARWLNLGMEVLISKMNAVVRSCRDFSSIRGVNFTLRFPFVPAVMAAMVLMIWYLPWRRRLRLPGAQESRDQLLHIIRQKDEKINQLLDQMAQMNQVLLSLQRVPTSKAG